MRSRRPAVRLLKMPRNGDNEPSEATSSNYATLLSLALLVRSALVTFITLVKERTNELYRV